MGEVGEVFGEGGGFLEGFPGFAADFGLGVFPEGLDFGENLGVAAECLAVEVEEGVVKLQHHFNPLFLRPFPFRDF